MASAAKVLAKLDKSEAKRAITILRQCQDVLDDPRSNGKALVGPHFAKYWRYRIGDYPNYLRYTR